MVEETFVSRLSAAIKTAGGPKAVSKKSGVPVSTLYSYQQGSDPSFSKLCQLASACSVSLDWLAWGTEKPSALPELPILQPNIMQAPAHFWGLFVLLRSCQEFYQQTKRVPTLLDVLTYIGPSYIASQEMNVPDTRIELTGEETSK